MNTAPKINKKMKTTDQNSTKFNNSFQEPIIVPLYSGRIIMYRRQGNGRELLYPWGWEKLL